MEYDGDVKFKILDAVSSPTFNLSLYAINAFDIIVHKDFEL